ncbi:MULTISPECIES: hypothetical protein [Rhizobium]|uniref:DUF7662 domain-containing protein n=1 Tax=Rhizobium TaxID=379 RepID=UPI0021B08F73|nr:MULTISPECIES: hypothetical protein [Rhizobium]
MSKYDPLGAYLRHQNRTHIPMTFRELERILGLKLPHSKVHRAWWSNNASNNVMTSQWLDAGYETESVDIAAEKLIFKKINDNDRKREGEGQPNLSEPGGSLRHPIFGSMKGTVTVMPDVDLTEPMVFEWGEKLYNE